MIPYVTGGMQQICTRSISQTEQMFNIESKLFQNLDIPGTGGIAGTKYSTLYI
jgi:hypothetical protein